jgi:hypothetical protein
MPPVRPFRLNRGTPVDRLARLAGRTAAVLAFAIACFLLFGLSALVAGYLAFVLSL